MEKEQIVENEKINQANIKTFKKYDLTKASEYIYKCCLCKRKVNLDNSASNQGDRLICMNCYFNKLGGTEKARRWINRED